jgi:hypothetical protein
MTTAFAVGIGPVVSKWRTLLNRTAGHNIGEEEAFALPVLGHRPTRLLLYWVLSENFPGITEVLQQIRIR